MERLVDVLAEVVRTPPGGPLEPETILIQSKGMERWLSNQLALRLGVFANARFPFPRTFIEEVFDAVVPARDSGAPPYSREVLSFSILALLDQLLEDPAFGAIRGYLQDDATGTKRFQLAERIAHVFDQYLVYRPRMVLKWEKGVGVDWQAKLWRALRAHLGGEHFASRALRFFREWSPLLLPAGAVPRRVSVVGISTLPPMYLKLLSQLSELSDVQLFVLSPSPEYFAQLRSLREVVHARRTGPELGFDDGELEALQGNPLLASLGRTGRQFQFVLERDTVYRESDQDLFEENSPRTMLEQLQRDIREMRDFSLAHAEKHQALPGDRSIRIMACHSPMREVEVLRDQVLGMLEDDRSLEPADFLVMSPSIDTYAPLIDAVFGVEPGDPLYVPYRIADRTERAQNLCAKALLQLLAVAQGRMTASEALDLLQLDPVRRRFEIEPSDLNRLQGYVHEAGIRWGIDAEHRASFQQPREFNNTWRFGLDRLLLGVALPACTGGLFQDTAPVDDVEGEAANLVGKLAEFMEMLFWAAASLTAPRNVEQWSEALQQLVERSLRTEDSEAWQQRAVFEAIHQIKAQAKQARFEAPIELVTIARELTHRFENERVSHQFLAGGLTFCAMLPMRSIPFRVVVLLGLNDGEFPRVEKRLSFDLLAEDPEPGDRSVKDEDRYLFLESILSARDRLLVSYVGRGIQDNAELPPSPVVSELIEYAQASFRCDASPIELLIEHPLQPFSPRYFQSGRSELFSFASSEALGADSLKRHRAQPEPFLARPLPAFEAPREIGLEELIRFLVNPARGFLQNRLGVFLGGDPRLVEDREPIELDALELHGLGAALLEKALGSASGEVLQGDLVATGSLPHGTPGNLTYQDIWQVVQQLVARTERWVEGARLDPVPLELEFGNATLHGTLRWLYPQAQVFCQYARVKPKNELGLWIRHLALSASARDELPRRSVLLGRPIDEARPQTEFCCFEPLKPEEAREHLARLIELYRLGHELVLPFFPAASKTFIEQLVFSKNPDEAKAFAKAREEFAPSFGNGHSESADAYVQRAFAGTDPLELASTSDGQQLGPTSLDFRAISKLVFLPLLHHTTREGEP